MLIDCQYLKTSKRLVCSYVDKSGKIKLKYFEWSNPEKYQNCDHLDQEKHPTLKSWDGRSVKKVACPSPDRYAVYEFLDALPEKEKTELFEYNEPETYFIDIETEIIDEFPDAKTAPTQVLSISIVYQDKIILLGLREMPDDMQKRIIDNTNKYFKKFNSAYKFKYIKYDDEFDMLKSFFEDMIPKMSCITGWNFINYDWAYLMNRVKKISKHINGTDVTIDYLASSPTRRVEEVWRSKEVAGYAYELPMHRLVFDYMQLYEAFDTSIKVKESSSLDFVSSKLVGVEKIKYTGSLQKLYNEDFETFMYYNAVDSVLVQKIHDARNYISIVFAVSALSKIKTKDVISPIKSALASLAITEGVLRDKFREMENIVLFRDDEKESETALLAGGWVKDPVTGMNQWVVCYDFASLYPTTQLEFFIAPENFVGVQHEKDTTMCTNGKKINLQEHVVCVNGVVFRKHTSPTLRMLEDVYADRKKAKGVMMKKKEEYKQVLDEIKQLEAELDLA